MINHPQNKVPSNNNSNSCNDNRDTLLPKTFRWRVGYWLSEKKLKKMNFEEFNDIARSVDIELVQIDLNKDLELQGPYDAIIHKLSDFIVLSDQGDTQASLLIGKLEKYLSDHPEIVVLDPFPCVRRLCDRYQQYSLIQEVCKTDDVYTPIFVDLTSADVEENKQKLQTFGVKYPFVCKPLVAHGTEFAHQMSIIFSDDGLKDVVPPCVAQTFIQHNAVLYKVFVVGDRYFVVPRPSLKNFTAGPFSTIFFDSHQVSKEGCSSSLSELDDLDPLSSPPLLDDKIAAVVQDIRRKTDITLFGLDVIVETKTGFHYIIDVNNFPSYDGVANFYSHLVDLIVDELKRCEQKLMEQASSIAMTIASSTTDLIKNSAAAAARTSAVSSTFSTSSTFSASRKSMSECFLDSGIGSCTESDNSDSERKLKALRIGSGGAAAAVAAADNQLTSADSAGPQHFATISTPTAAFAEHVQQQQLPSWNRIKRFYGIPKPPVRPRIP